jgi:hypothetical protein
VMMNDNGMEWNDLAIIICSKEANA